MKDELKYWVALNRIFCEKLYQLKKIRRGFSDISEIFSADSHDLGALGIERSLIKKLRSNTNLDDAGREIDRAEKKGYTILTIEDESYPPYLREIFDPPVVLYCAGEVDLLSRPSVAVIGARKPSPYGVAVAEKLASDLAARGFPVVSGLARGIDALAHWGALQSGRTVAVMGSGFDHVYPKENRKLFEKIVEKGVVVTEYPFNSLPLGFHFPLRNRIISGLVLALVVVEAARKSGSLITARLALEQNREVMAVPGNITSDLSQGTNWLLKSGAKPVESWRDIVEELPLEYRKGIDVVEIEGHQDPESLDPMEKEIYDCLSTTELIYIDEIVDRLDRSVSEILTGLLNLELKGLITQNPGKLFQRKM